MIVWILLAGVVSVVSLFNYYLNRAPGSDPEDFLVGPPGLGVTCDCFLNTLILGAILIIGLAASAGAFATRNELYLAGGVSFLVVTLAGLFGRRRRHREWRETAKALHRAIPFGVTDPYQRSSVHLIFDDEEEEDDNNLDEL